jgi:hypothetical protein
MDFWQSLDRATSWTPRSTPTLRSTPAPYAADGGTYDAPNQPMAGRTTPTFRSTPAPSTANGGTYDAAKGFISAPMTTKYNGQGLPYNTATGSAAHAAASTGIGVATVPLSLHNAKRSSPGDSASPADAYSTLGVQQADLQPQVMHQTYRHSACKKYTGKHPFCI